MIHIGGFEEINWVALCPLKCSPRPFSRLLVEVFLLKAKLSLTWTKIALKLHESALWIFTTIAKKAWSHKLASLIIIGGNENTHRTSKNPSKKNRFWTQQRWVSYSVEVVGKIGWMENEIRGRHGFTVWNAFVHFPVKTVVSQKLSVWKTRHTHTQVK